MSKLMLLKLCWYLIKFMTLFGPWGYVLYSIYAWWSYVPPIVIPLPPTKCLINNSPLFDNLSSFIEFKNDLVKNLIICTILLLFMKIFINRFYRPHKVSNGDTFFEPERMVDGSVFIAEEMPKFQAKIFGKIGKEVFRSGQAFRVGQHLVTAKHVVDPYSEILIVSGRGELTIESSRFKLVEGDFARVLLSDVEIAQLQLSKAILSETVVETSGLFCKATGYASSSLGMLESHPAFGFLKYKGSTCGGFSGAPYFVGNRVYGMHLGGCSENIGYSSAYLHMLMRSCEESSEDYLFQMTKKYEKYAYERSPYDPDEYRLRIGDRYYLVDSETLRKLESKRSAVTYTAENHGDRDERIVQVAPPQDSQNGALMEEVAEILKNFAEEVQLPKNDKAPERVNATGATGRSSPKPVASRKRSPVRQETTSSRTPQSSDSNGLKQIRVQRDEAFKSISESLRKLRLARGHLQTTFNNKQLKNPSTLSEFSRLDALQMELLRVASEIGSIMASNS